MLKIEYIMLNFFILKTNLHQSISGLKSLHLAL